MSNKVKDIDLKIINLKFFDPNNARMDGKSCKVVIVYHIGYVTIKDSKYVKINSVNFYTLLFTNRMDTLKKLMEINI